MKIVKKGMYGYRRWHQFRLMASGILLGLVMYFLFMLSLRISKLPSTILTVFIVLAVIPLSLAIVMSFIASRAKTPSEERHAYAAQQADLKQHLEHYMTVDHIGFKIVLGYGDKGFFEAVDNLPRFSLDALPKERREKVLKCKRTLLGLSF